MSAAARPVLNLTLRPNPPMPAAALGIVLAALLAFNAAFAAYFISRGAWPIAPFMGADIAILALAFRASIRASRRTEEVLLMPDFLRIRRTAPERAVRESEFNPYWVRLQRPDPEIPGSQLVVTSHGRSEILGAFLSPQERIRTADMLAAALNRLRTSRDF